MEEIIPEALVTTAPGGPVKITLPSIKRLVSNASRSIFLTGSVPLTGIGRLMIGLESISRVEPIELGEAPFLDKVFSNAVVMSLKLAFNVLVAVVG